MEQAKLRISAGTPLGDRVTYGRVGYAGEPYAPLLGTYRGADVVRFAYTTVADSGRYPCGRSLKNLHPLVALTMYEAAFALEAGPLTTWSN